MEFMKKEEKQPLLANEKNQISQTQPPMRYGLAFLGFCAFANLHAMSSDMSIAIVAMVNSSAKASDYGPDGNETCFELLPKYNNASKIPKTQSTSGLFNWDENARALVLGSYFYGYIITKIPGGMLAERFGPKLILGISVLFTSLFTMLTPLAADGGIVMLCLLRSFVGLSEGLAIPATQVFIGQYASETQRSRYSAIIFTGQYLGTIILMPVSGVLADSNVFGGWPSIFYCFGFSGFCWVIAWFCFTYERKTLRISYPSVQYSHDVLHKKWHKTPWFSILSSAPFWAVIITNFCANWGYYTFTSEMPTYLANVLHFDIKKNGVLSALPAVSTAMFAWVGSYFADKLCQSRKLSVTTTRKLMNSLGMLAPGATVWCISVLGCQPSLIMVLYTLSMGFSGFTFSGYHVTPVDMSPKFAGTLMGISCTLSNTTGFLTLLVIGKIIANGETLENWGYVFGISAGMQLFGGVVFNLFASAELQPWSEDTDSEQTNTADA